MNGASSSIFAKIARGEIPCQRVYEDAHVLAFLDINPIAKGHTLLIPKKPVERLEELAPEDAAAMSSVVPGLVRRIRAVTGAAGCNILVNDGRVAGQEVPYVHVHIIPRQAEDGLGYRWRAKPGDRMELEALAARIREVP